MNTPEEKKFPGGVSTWESFRNETTKKEKSKIASILNSGLFNRKQDPSEVEFRLLNCLIHSPNVIKKFNEYEYLFSKKGMIILNAVDQLVSEGVTVDYLTLYKSNRISDLALMFKIMEGDPCLTSQVDFFLKHLRAETLEIHIKNFHFQLLEISDPYQKLDFIYQFSEFTQEFIGGVK